MASLKTVSHYTVHLQFIWYASTTLQFKKNSYISLCDISIDYIKKLKLKKQGKNFQQ